LQGQEGYLTLDQDSQNDRYPTDLMFLRRVALIKQNGKARFIWRTESL